jgi:hypothetical protein
MRLGAALLVLAAALAAHGQTATAIEAGPRVLASSPRLARVQASVPGEGVREIDDPHTGARWLLMRDSSHPGGPGRMVQVKSVGDPVLQNKTAVEPHRVELRPVLHAGERLIVEEDTPLVEARLEAVALGPADLGSALDVRLKIGGKVVRAVALAPGRAVLQPETEARP